MAKYQFSMSIPFTCGPKSPVRKKEGSFVIEKTTCEVRRASPVKSGPGVPGRSPARGRGARWASRNMRGALACPVAYGARLQLVAPGRGQRAPWVLGAFPLRSSCPFKPKSRERWGGGVWGAAGWTPFQADRRKR